MSRDIRPQLRMDAIPCTSLQPAPYMLADVFLNRRLNVWWPIKFWIHHFVSVPEIALLI